ncbi:lysozyme inhibitor LprI family protein [Lysobacter enzymogenes]|uniref:lysozyme inhibitor LprI family protein n=1 Tax=Lysobacter enzymogenes TaxID=69 RepID=UPI0033963888
MATSALAISALIRPAAAEGACPSGYYQSNQSGYGYVACAPIPEQPPPVRMILRWGAVAGDDDGHWGMSESRRFRLQATREALKRCRESGGKGCRLAQVYGDSCVAIASDSNSAPLSVALACVCASACIADARIADARTPTHARAEVAHTTAPRPHYQRCLDASGGVTPTMQDCIDTEYAYQDRRLNQVYRRLIASLPKAEAARLRERQRAWIGQRDRDCDPDAAPGQGQLLGADGCRVRKTAERAAQLQTQLDRAR